MGRYIEHINNVYAEYGDWSWDYIKQNKPKEYYDTQFIEVELSEGSKIWKEKVPINELVDIKKNIKTYSWDWNKNKSLHKWLFDYLKNRGVKIDCIIGATLGTFELEYEKAKVDGYYLQTEIGDENIVLSLIKTRHEIKNYKDYEWIRLRLLRPYYEK